MLNIDELKFDEKAKKPPSKLKHPSTVTRTINTELHRTAAKANQDENVAAEASLNAEKGVETALREGDHAFHAHKLRTHRKEEKRLDNANIKALEKADIVLKNGFESSISQPHATSGSL